ncbi:MAG: FG-GAP repeat protein [Xanthomonadales bacterium]|nr:FG-GAP repeat protein [Xanthomonadales bacterium]
MNRSPTRARWALLIAGVLCAHGAQAQLSSTDSRLFLRNTADGLPFAILGRLEPSVPGFGEAMAVGDFNCDGIEDLAIGAPDANANNVVQSGQIVIAYGSAQGLRSNDGIGLSQSSPNMPGGSEVGDYFGWALAAGDLTNDGCDDLAVGTPGESFDEALLPPLGVTSAGSVTLVRGRLGGATGQGALNVPSEADFAFGGGTLVGEGMNYGEALAIANIFSASGTSSELIVGAPGVDLACSFYCVDSNVIEVRAARNFAPLERRVGYVLPSMQYILPLPSTVRFGGALAAGNFDGDGLPDVAIGVPNDPPDRSGAVEVLYGGLPPLGSGGRVYFKQSASGIPGLDDPGDRFGSVLAAGDFDGDGDSDLVIGIPEKQSSASLRSGALIIRAGRSDGVNGFGISSNWTNPDVGLPNAASDRFAQSLAVGDFNGDGFDDLAAGAPGVNTSGVSNSGALVVLYGSASGIELTGRQIWHKGSTGIPGELGVDEEFGAGLAAGDFNDDGVDDLVVAIPQQILGTTPRGGVLVIYGRRAAPPPSALFANGFE